MSIVPVLLMLYIMLSERIRIEKSGKRSIADVIVGIVVLLFVIAWVSVHEDCVRKCCEVGLSVVCLQKGIELRFPVGSRMRSIMVSVFLCFVGACLMVLSICNCKTAVCRQCDSSNAMCGGGQYKSQLQDVVETGSGNKGLALDDRAAKVCDNLYGGGSYEAAQVVRLNSGDSIIYRIQLSNGSNCVIKVLKDSERAIVPIAD